MTIAVLPDDEKGRLGDIPEEKRRKLYYAALAEFLKSQKCAEWTDEQRREALRLARLAPGF